MKSVATVLIAALTLAVPVIAGEQQVQVVNTTTHPVPVALTGTTAVSVNNTPAVTISGTPAVNIPNGVAITNTPNVNIGSPTVSIGNSPTVTIGGATVPLPVQSGDDRNAFQIYFLLATGEEYNLAIPAGKRLVVDFVSFRNTINFCNCNPLLEVILTANLLGNDCKFYLLAQQTPSNVVFRGVYPVKIYAEQLKVQLTGSQTQTAEVSISGHLVTL